MSFAWVAVGVAIVGAATSISLTAASMSQQKKAARRQLEAQSMQAKVSANQRIRAARRMAAQQKSSFLASGISLTGEGTPDAIISETYDIGMQDVENIKQYGAVQGANITAKNRANMMAGYASMASDVSSLATSLGSSAGSLKGADTVNVGGDLDGMGDTYGMGGLGEGSALDFNNYQAPSSFGAQYNY